MTIAYIAITLLLALGGWFAYAETKRRPSKIFRTDETGALVPKE